MEPGSEPLVGLARDLRKLRQEAGSPTYRELSRRAHYSAAALSEAASGRRLPSLPVTLAFVAACDGDTAEWEQRWRAVEAETSTTAEPDGSERAPYAGLAAFQVGDADRFFGREDLVADLLTRVRNHRFVGVFGASGSGKSSVLRAGLMAHLTRDDRPVVVFTPGPHPIEECAVQLAALLNVPSTTLLAEFATSPKNLHLRIRQAMADRDDDADLVLVVDQFEEVFTLCADPDERAWLITALTTAASVPTSQTRVVLGVRADFYGHCGRYAELVDALRDAQVLVGPMTSEELRRAITEPAALAGRRVETALVTELVAAAANHPGVLPLVSHVLLETWRRRRGTTLTLAGYEAAGGLRTALARTAETIYTGLAADQQASTKHILLRLCALDDTGAATKRRISRREVDDGAPNTSTVLDRLAQARLITLDRDGVELTHEALIGHWPRLHDWLTENRDGLRIHRQLTDAAQTWNALERDPGALYRGTRLALAGEWAGQDGHRSQLNPAEQDFLDASTAAEATERQTVARRQRQFRYLTLCLTVLLLVATAVGVVAIDQGRDAVRQSQDAISRQLAAQALTLVESRPGNAMLLGVEAFRTSPTTEARGALLSLSAHQTYQTELIGHKDPISELAFSPDGNTLATASRDQSVVLWDTQQRTRRATLTAHATWLRAVEFSPDGRVLATGGDDKNVVLWDVATAAPLATLTGHTASVKAVAFSPDARRVATAGSDQTIRLWDTKTHTQLAQLTGHVGVVQAVAFSPDGRTLATGGADRTVRLWDAATGAQLASLASHTKSADAVAFSPDGRTLASASPDRTVRLWDVAQRTQLATLSGHTGDARAVAFSPDGRTLASAGHDHTVILWDTASRKLLHRLTGHPDNIYTLSFDRQRSMLASAGENGTVILWDPTERPLAGHSDWIHDVDLSPDGRTIATAGKDGAVMLWDADSRSRLATRTAESASVNAVAFSPDGRTLAAGTGSDTDLPTAANFAVTLWDTTANTPSIALTGHTNRVQDIAFSPDGRTLASAGFDGKVILWDLASRTPVATLTHPDGLHGVDFSPDGRTLATAGQDQTLVLWDVAKRSRITTLTGHTGALREVAFSPDGRTLASAGIDRTVILWDVDRRTPSAVLDGIPGSVNALAFSPDGRMLAAGLTDRTVRLWDVDRRAHLATLSGSHTEPVRAVAFSADGTTLASAGADQTATLWTTDPERTAKRICDTLARDLTHDEWRQSLPETPYRATCN
ncbi:hypothetical protein HPO96_04990 [Kribbella sandramycini]|uniref:HTH cro/C1-type domain-containing protein n=1 Tax=Kribbella sandramycini TaxID=60450 RepID=A0A7Y4KX99_9ACTN|nr:hypothetical protein [Kribbella sandramycini]